MKESVWRGRKVFVTGHTGFKGGWLWQMLARSGAELCGYSKEPETTPSLYHAARLADFGRSEIGDIRDTDRLERALCEFQPEVLFHLAAQPLVRQSYRDPVETYSTNVMGLISVFEAIRKTSSVQVVVNVTSDKCYENREWHWGYRETDPLGGFDPYSSSKGCAEIVTASWRRSFFEPAGIRLASVRAGNVIGGGDWAGDRLIPDFIRSFSAGQKVLIRSPRSTRPWQHVLEPVDGYLHLAERMMKDGRLSDAWNFGPDTGSVKNVQWIADCVCRLWGDGASYVIAENAEWHEAFNLTLDNSKALALLCWKPRWTLREALEHTILWYKDLSSGVDARDLCARDIAKYARSVSAA